MSITLILLISAGLVTTVKVILLPETVVEADKKFLIIGNQNAITYKEIFRKTDALFYGIFFFLTNFKVKVISD